LSFAWPAFFLRGPCQETLKRWDDMAPSRHVVGIGELDNHDTLKRLGGWTFSVFPFHRVFHLIHTHILTGEPFSGNRQNDIDAVLSALRQGHCYVSLDYFRQAAGFTMTLRDNTTEASIGDHFALGDAAVLHVSLPYKAKIRLIKNGAAIQESLGSHVSVTIDQPGVYRVEAYVKAFGRYRPWIFTNHIYVDRP